MVKTKLAAAYFFAAVLFCAPACQPRMTWERVLLDGSRTGVTSVTGDNVTDALGIVEYSTEAASAAATAATAAAAPKFIYYAPNGRVFERGATPTVAAHLISYQPELQNLKQVIGFCPQGMSKAGDETEATLSQWASDVLLTAGESIYNRKFDVSILNRGGIRVDMPKGDVMLGDILAMFPFRNNIVGIELKGDDLEDLFELIAQSGHFSFGGARIEVKDKELHSIEIGGKPLEEDKVYSLVTVDFLLMGGDGMKAGEKAINILDKEVKVSDWMVPYIKTAYAGGAVIEYQNDGRFKRI